MSDKRTIVALSIHLGVEQTSHLKAHYFQTSLCFSLFLPFISSTFLSFLSQIFHLSFSSFSLFFLFLLLVPSFPCFLIMPFRLLCFNGFLLNGNFCGIYKHCTIQIIYCRYLNTDDKTLDQFACTPQMQEHFLAIQKCFDIIGFSQEVQAC